jgi:hypothetical protein
MLKQGFYVVQLNYIDHWRIHAIISLSLFCQTNIGHCSVFVMGLIIAGGNGIACYLYRRQLSIEICK